MTKKLKIVAAILLSCLLGVVVTNDINHFAQTDAAKPASPFTPTQEDRIGEIAANWLIAHPEVLVKASKTLQARREMTAMDKDRTMRADIQPK